MAGRTRQAANHPENAEFGRIILQTTNLDVRALRIPFSLVTPTPSPSPDEMVINSRGRKTTPQHWSPISLEKFRNEPCTVNNVTPVKADTTRYYGPVRSSPRKRLTLGDSPNSKESGLHTLPLKCKKVSTPTKRKLVLSVNQSHSGVLTDELRALSHDQLVNLVVDIIYSQQEQLKAVTNLIPEPDLRPFDTRLLKLRQNIFRAMPNNRLTSKTDSPAFHKVVTHLHCFKEACIDQGKHLVDCHAWSAVLQYVCMAWSHVRATPIWDNPPHNKIREQCFKFLTSFALKALKRGNWDSESKTEMLTRFNDMVVDNPDMLACVNYLQTEIS